MVLKIKKGIDKDPILIYIILLVEYVNTILRQFNLIPVSRSVLLREILFIFLLCLLIYNFITNGFQISKSIAISLLFYLSVAFSLILHPKDLNITAISNVFMPAILIMLTSYYKFIEEKRRRVLFILYFALTCLLYISNVIFGAYRYKTEGLNSIYFFLLLIPFIFYDTNKYVKSLLLIVASILGIVSFKATVIIVLGAIFLIYYFTSRKTVSIKIFLFPIIALFFLCVIILFSKQILNIDIYNMYIKESLLDGGNGRISIWTAIIQMIQNNSIFSFIEGNGYDAVSNALSISAHNDLLEILYDYGFISLLLYLAYLHYIFLCGRKLKGNSLQLFLMLYSEMIIMILFSNSIFVASYYLIIVTTLNMLINPHNTQETTKKC